MQVPRHLLIGASLLVVWISFSSARGTIYYVDQRAVGANNGQNWNNAFTNLHEAFAVAGPGDTVRIAQGTYTPDVGHPVYGVGDRRACWTYPAGAHLEGCYYGLGNPFPDYRSYSTTPTILSGEIGDPASIEDNSNTLIRADGPGEVWMFMFYVRGCYHDDTSDGRPGGAISISGASNVVLSTMTFSNNVMITNSGSGGGAAVGIVNSPGNISGDFISNTVSGTHDARGGALYALNSDLSIPASFEANSVSSTGGAALGGAAYVEQGFPQFWNASFTNNSAAIGGAVYYLNAWLPPPSDQSTLTGLPTTWNTVFQSNSAVRGGALAVNSINPADTIDLTNDWFLDNTTTQEGGAVYLPVAPTGQGIAFRMLSCVSAGNSAGGPAQGAVVDAGSRLAVYSSVFADNGPGCFISARGARVDVYNSILRGDGAGQPLITGAPGTAGTVAYCDVEGPLPGGFTTTHIVTADPEFTDQAGRDFTILGSSPCIDAGDNSHYAPYISSQWWSTPPPFDDAFVADTGLGPAPIVDIGISEYSYVLCPADFNMDGDTGTDLDIEDFFACLAGNCCPTCQSVDINGDGDVGTDSDIELFFRFIAGGCGP